MVGQEVGRQVVVVDREVGRVEEDKGAFRCAVAFL